MTPDRIIVGTDSTQAQAWMEDLYAPFSRSRDKLMVMGIRDAEMTKYVANAMLATKISFMNEVATICDQLSVDVENVRRGIGSDSRIGNAFIYPGCGYGGSCFPKDVKALIHTSEQAGVEPEVLKSVEDRNELQKKVLFNKINHHFKNQLSGLTFGIWGLSFKPGTDDVREASSVVLIKSLVEAGANVKAYDPEAMETIKAEIPSEWVGNQVKLVEQPYEAITYADAMVLVTEWKRFRQPDFDRIKSLLKQPVIFDGRNQYNPSRLRENGFDYYGIGR